MYECVRQARLGQAIIHRNRFPVFSKVACDGIVLAILRVAEHGELDYQRLKMILRDLLMMYPDAMIPYQGKGRSGDFVWTAGFIADRISTILAHVRRLAFSDTRLRQASRTLSERESG